MKTASFSKAGRKSVNQDSTLIKKLNDSSIALAIADGMGGKPGGEVASQLAMDAVESALSTNPDATIDYIFEEAKNAFHIKQKTLKNTKAWEQL